MRNTIKFITALFTVLFFSACGGGGDDGPPPNSAPTQVTQVTFPTADLLCVNNNINFQWNASSDADNDPISYRIVIALDRPLTNIVEQRTVNNNSVTITLQQGVAYYWNVTAIDDMGQASEPSQTLAFFTSGPGITNYAPFTAALNAPADESTVAAGQLTLEWTGGDTDAGDTLTYDLYFGQTNDPPLNQAGLTTESAAVTTTAGNTYFWRVDSIDNSGIKTIGQVWTFSTN
ncbi:hypothetical protein ACFQ1Q_04665 [Winogradskyella litorisediminis]|uniref:Fibronectin type-III domain-containing protein n=1 Tax=Winogradskyella litorisediminis TaxID=1156618 RepID=A0ABW3N4D8_9FLAO